jgi:hypothetical protein
MSYFNPASDCTYLLFPLLYAEIHYQIGHLISLIKKREPECVVDMPHRLEPGHRLPLLLLIKDAHLYPVCLHSLTATLIEKRQKTELFRRDFSALDITEPFWNQVFNITLPRTFPEKVKIDIEVAYSVDGKQKSFHNDNYRFTSHRPFEIIIDSHPLPTKRHWYFGDLHYHSDFTNDQVEYGAPLPATREMAKAMGLNFFAATDHSYDLDDKFGDYLTNDPAQPKWHQMRETIEYMNKTDKSFVVIPGEELSVGNAAGRNVHFLILNNLSFIAGSGDSAEKWLNNRPDCDIDTIVNQIDGTAVAFAAHPEIIPPLLQRLLLKRGKWRDPDYRSDILNGLQIWNSRKDKFFLRGIEKWVDQLKTGRRMSIIAGNDAHGNFGRFRQVGVPHLQMREDSSEIFGRARTGIYCENRLTLESLISALRSGRAIVTDGPFAEILLSNGPTDHSRIGDTFSGSRGDLHIDVRSSGLFGALQSVDLCVGDVDKNREIKVSLGLKPDCMTLNIKRHLTDLPELGWIRLEVQSARDGRHYRCLTNPIYLQQRIKKV